MDCREVRYALGLESGRDRLGPALREHLRECGECEAVVSRRGAFDAALAGSLVMPAPPALSRRLAALAREHARTAAAGEPPGRMAAASSDRAPRLVSTLERALWIAALILGVAALGAVVWTGPLAPLARGGLELLVAARVLLTSPLMWLLPEWGMVLSWFGAAVATLSLAWLLRSQRLAQASGPRQARRF